MFFITGVCGSGKTTVGNYLKDLLDDRYIVRDFDERGVPENVGSDWHPNETKFWINEGIKADKEGSTLVVTGFCNPESLKKIHSNDDIEVKIILLHADRETIKSRFDGRYKTDESKVNMEKIVGQKLEDFSTNNANFALQLKKICEENSCVVIDTTEKNPGAVAEEVARSIKQM